MPACKKGAAGIRARVSYREIRALSAGSSYVYNKYASELGVIILSPKSEQVLSTLTFERGSCLSSLIGVGFRCLYRLGAR